MTVVVTGLTAERMLEMEAQTIIDAHLAGDDLILVQRDLTEVNVGSVRGLQGIQGTAGTNGSGYVICTSGTRPGSPAEGLVIYETDTDLVRVWTGTRWRLQERIVCTNATRPAGLVAADEGVKIYETDTNNEFYWNGSGWSTVPWGSRIVTSGTRPSSPFIGQQIYETDTGNTLIYQSATTGWTKPWNLPWGQITTAMSVAAQNGISANAAVTGVTATFTAVANRIYRTKISGLLQQVSGPGIITPIILDGPGSTKWQNNITATSGYFPLSAELTDIGLAAGSVTRKLNLSTSVGTVNVRGDVAPGIRITVFDDGPNGAPL